MFEIEQRCTTALFGEIYSHIAHIAAIFPGDAKSSRSFARQNLAAGVALELIVAADHGFSRDRHEPLANAVELGDRRPDRAYWCRESPRHAQHARFPLVSAERAQFSRHQLQRINCFVDHETPRFERNFQLSRCCRCTATSSPAALLPIALHSATRSGSQ